MACGEVRRVFRSETDEYNERLGEMGCIPWGNIHRERINPGRGVSSKLPLNNTVYQYIYIYINTSTGSSVQSNGQTTERGSIKKLSEALLHLRFGALPSGDVTDGVDVFSPPPVFDRLSARVI